VLFEVPFMHRRLLPGEQWRWYLVDMGVPLVVSLLIQGLIRLIMPADAPLLLALGLIGIGGVLAFAGSVLLLPGLRGAVAGFLAAVLRKRHASQSRTRLDVEA
jgi:hypothetical protein